MYLVVGVLSVVGLFTFWAVGVKAVPFSSEPVPIQEEVVVNSEQMLCLEAPSVVLTGATVPIKVTLLDENLRPIAMQPIVLTCESGSFESAVIFNEFGEIEQVLYDPQVTDFTNSLGEVEVVWHAPSEAGLAKITAWYFGPEEGQVYSQETHVWVTEDPNLHQITIFCVPARMVLGDKEQEDKFVLLSIKVSDAHGNPISGETVYLQTTLGQFEQQFVVDEDGYGRLVVSRSSQISLVTHESGEVVAVLVPPPSPGIATITATTSNGQARTTYVFGSIEGLHLTSDSYAAVGDNGALIIAKLYNALGEPIVGQTVTFQTNLGQLSNIQAVTDENGEASVILTAGGDEGTAVVTASALGYSAKIYVDVFGDLHSHNVPSSLFSLVSLQSPPSP
mgnify:CR=1 FL=1